MLELQENELTNITGYSKMNSGRPVILQLHGSFEAFGVVFDYLDGDEMPDWIVLAGC